MISLLDTEIHPNDHLAVQTCLQSGWVSTAGSQIGEFEADLSGWFAGRKAIATSSGTAALHLALLSIGVTHNDWILVPDLTFIASVNAVSYCHALPIFVDIDPHTLNLCPNDLIRAIQQAKQAGKLPKALLAVHLFGHSAPMEEIAKICQNEGIALIEDASQALGSTHTKVPLGCFGACAATSFNGNKIITSGGGGSVITPSEERAIWIRHLSQQARLQPDYVHDEIGYNYRMPNLNACLGKSQLSRLPSILGKKRAVYQRYQQALVGQDFVHLLKPLSQTQSNHWVNIAIFDLKKITVSIDKIQNKLLKMGIETRKIYLPLHLQKPYCSPPLLRPLPQSEVAHRRSLILPSSHLLSIKDQEIVVRTLLDFRI